jgi:hypothetical protein
VVTAPGYEPIVITAGYSTPENAPQEVYIPDVSVIENTNRVEQEIQTQIIVDEDDPRGPNAVLETPDTNNKSTVIIAVTSPSCCCCASPTA